MRKNEFKIGLEFFTPTGRWRCTDVGTRTIVAIKLDAPDEHWYSGPPFGVVESVFDENDIKGCLKTYRQAVKAWGEEFKELEKRRFRPACSVPLETNLSEEQLFSLALDVLNKIDPMGLRPGKRSGAPEDEYSQEAKPIADYLRYLQQTGRITSSTLVTMIQGVWIWKFGEETEAAEEVAHTLIERLTGWKSGNDRKKRRRGRNA